MSRARSDKKSTPAKKPRNKSALKVTLISLVAVAILVAIGWATAVLYNQHAEPSHTSQISNTPTSIPILIPIPTLALALKTITVP